MRREALFDIEVTYTTCLLQEEQHDAVQASAAPEVDPAAQGYASSPERPLITNKSNKLEWQDGQFPVTRCIAQHATACMSLWHGKMVSPMSSYA